MRGSNGKVGVQSGMVVLWMALAVLALIDLAWCRALGLSFTNWLPFLVAIGGIAAIGLIYGLTGRSARIAWTANGLLLWMIGSLLGAILTYAAAALGGPLYDSALDAADAALGFDWMTWCNFIWGRPALHLILALAYVSLLPQILLSVIWFSFRGWEYRNAELLTNFILAILITTAVFHRYPALGPGVGLASFRGAYIDQLIDLRGGRLAMLDVMHLKGVIAFPSFHAVTAILFTYAHRRSGSFIAVAIVNGLMLLSIPSEGGHYLVDVLAGVTVAGLAILATGALRQRNRLRWPHRARRASPSPLRPEGEVR
jgi:PAP2 superfamily